MKHYKVYVLACYIALCSLVGCSGHTFTREGATIKSGKRFKYEIELFGESQYGFWGRGPRLPYKERSSYWIFTNSDTGEIAAYDLAFAYEHDNILRQPGDSILTGKIIISKDSLRVMLNYPFWDSDGIIQEYREFIFNGSYYLLRK